MMGLCNRWCMYHEVYQQLVVIFVPKPLTVSKWRIIVGHSLNHISCDSSWFSPDTGHRSSESCFSGCHLCIVIDLNVKAASSNVLTVVRFTPLNYTTDAREVIDWLLFCISKLQGTSGTQTSSCWYFREGEGGDDEELPEEESAAFSEWNVFIWYKFNIATLIFECISTRIIKVNSIFSSRSVCSCRTW